MSAAPPKRPAHRPSRRDDIVAAAVELFAERPPGEVTIADIADRAGMTSAAVYYHFSAKDDVLLEALRGFAEELIVQLRRLSQRANGEDPLRGLVAGFLDWIDERRPAATVFFVSSLGSTPAAEALRRDLRNRLIPLTSRAARRARGAVNRTQLSVIGLALVSLLETAATAQLTKDDAYRVLGARSFRDHVTGLATRIVDAGG